MERSPAFVILTIYISPKPYKNIYKIGIINPTQHMQWCLSKFIPVIRIRT